MRVLHGLSILLFAVNLAAGGSNDVPAQRVAEDSSKIVAVYGRLISTSHRERVAAFRELPSSTKAAIWRHHLTKTLAEHPDLSPEQRSIIEDFIAVLTPDLYERAAHDPEAAPPDALEGIRRRAWAAFPRELLVGIFLDLRESTDRHTGTTTASLQPRATDAPPSCNCNRNFDDCFFWEGDGSYCALECYFTSSYGCGPGWVLSCNGWCTPPDLPQ